MALSAALLAWVEKKKEKEKETEPEEADEMKERGEGDRM